PDVAALKWWAGKQSTFPTVVKLARKHLAKQASSAASESLFSVGGSTITKKRNRLLKWRWQPISFFCTRL
ncbi:unnamed protein product, partial [Laminaria digitata]